MRKHAYKYETKGEALYGFFRRWLAEDKPATLIDDWLSRITFYGDLWSEYVEQSIAVWLTGRAVAAGRSLSEQSGGYYSREFRSYLNDMIEIDRASLDQLVRLAIDAVDAADTPMSNGLKNHLRSWAMTEHNTCYMCSTRLDFTDPHLPTSFTREHVWPQSYGGDSILENLLPACSRCNSKRKANYATWATTSIQSAILRMTPTVDDWSNFHGSHSFALHHFAGQQLAIDRKLSLKAAFLQIGPWTFPPLIRERTEVTHFFNLFNATVA